MKTNVIHLRPDRLNLPLETCVVGHRSSSVFTIVGDIPDDTDTMIVQVSRTDDQTTHEPRDPLAAACHKQDDGSWRCYLSPFYFPDISESLSYQIIATDTAGNPRWLGTGSLRICRNAANGTAITPPVIPHDAYAYNPVTGKYHAMRAEVNEYGEITITVDQEGIDR